MGSLNFCFTKQCVLHVIAFAFGLYGAWLVSAINSDFDGGYRMGRLAITLMNRLEAKEVRLGTNLTSSLYLFCELFINL